MCKHHSTYIYPDSMYVQNVKTGSLLISQRSCLLLYVDASGARPNTVVSDLNCLLTVSCWKRSNIRRKTQNWQWITNSCVNPHDNVQLESVTGVWNLLCSSFYLLLPVCLISSTNICFSPSFSRQLWKGVETWHDKEEQGGSVYFMVRRTRAFINNVRVFGHFFFFLPLLLLDIPSHPLALSSLQRSLWVGGHVQYVLVLAFSWSTTEKLHHSFHRKCSQSNPKF